MTSPENLGSQFDLDRKAHIAKLVADVKTAQDVRSMQEHAKNNIFRPRNSVVKKTRYKRDSSNG